MHQTTSSMPAKRQQSIMDYLNERRSITIKEAANLCKVSEATARRDLDEMAGMGYLERTHGGAVIERGTGLERGVDEKMKLMIPEKDENRPESGRIDKRRMQYFSGFRDNDTFAGQDLT